MSYHKIYSYLLLIVALSGGCVQEFDPPAQGYENLLVVEAFLSNEDEPFEVRLSRSVPIDTSAFVPESGAQITLSERDGATFVLSEKRTGVYQSSGMIAAQAGRTYQLQIKTASGTRYLSDEVVMRPTPAIDEVSFIFGEKPNGDLGAQVYIDTHDPDNNTWYYRWEWQETWEFRTPYNSYIYYDEGEIKLREEDINTCWKSGRSTSIEVATSKNLSSDHISDYPIHFVSAKTDRLNFRYSMLVKQFALSEESYVFWNEMKKFTETLGTLFDPQPSVIKGNIHNVADDKEIVIGYFDASEVKEQRIFIRNSDLPSIRFPNYFSSCEDTIVSEDMIPAMLATNYMLVAEEMDMTGLPVYLFSTAGCVDCTKYGTNVKPPFWN